MMLQKVTLGVNIPRLNKRAFSTGLHLRSISLIEELENEEQVQTPRKISTMYKTLCSWKSKKSLEEVLFKNVLYYNPEDSSGLIAINKPYGLPNYPSEDCKYSLKSCLPALAVKLQTDNLQIIKGTDRYMSGITLLSSKKETTEKLQKCIHERKSSRTFGNSYFCLVDGHCDLKLTETVCVQFKEVPGVGPSAFSKVHKQPVITSSNKILPHHKRRSQNIKVRQVDLMSLHRSSKVPLTLVSISPKSTKNHFIRVYLANRGYPVLGDNMYSYLVKSIFGTKVKSGNISATKMQTNQILPSATLQLLGLNKNEVWRIPTFIHHWRCVLPSWLGKGRDVTIFAPPPTHFNKTLQEVGIRFNFKEFADSDKPRIFSPRERTKKKKEDNEDDDVIVIN